MNNKKNKPYNLLHITSKLNAKSILKEGFKISKHNPDKNQNQWLGDGVYFWDGNDDGIEEFGKEVLSNKFLKRSMICLYGTIQIDKNNHINLEEANDREAFCKFINVFFPKAEEMLNLLEILREEKSVNKRDMAKIGKLLGKSINLYMKYLDEQKIIVDMVSCYFYHGTNKLNLFGRIERARRQFCIKNLEFLNNNIEKFKVY